MCYLYEKQSFISVRNWCNAITVNFAVHYTISAIIKINRCNCLGQVLYYLLVKKRKVKHFYQNRWFSGLNHCVFKQACASNPCTLLNVILFQIAGCVILNSNFTCYCWSFHVKGSQIRPQEQSFSSLPFVRNIKH